MDWRVAVASHIIDDIKSHEAFKVVIDCAEKADWRVKEDHRTQNKFWDLVEAFAILRYRQRVIDTEGWLHALVEDFNEAKTVFMKRRFSHRTHLTGAQTKVVKSVIALQNEPDGATQARIAEDLGISFRAVSKSLNAIEANTRFIVHELNRGTNFYRCTVPALEVLYSEGNIVSLPDDYKDSTMFLPPFYHVSTTILSNKINNNGCKRVERVSNLKECNNELPKVDETLLCSENRAKQANEQAATQAKVETQVETGPNPRKFALPLKVKFLKPCGRFVGEDLHIPGEITNYGPYEIGNVATLPKLNATTLIMKGVAVEASA